VAIAGHLIAANDDWERCELHPIKPAGPLIEESREKAWVEF
jgi:hypothetical protein